MKNVYKLLTILLLINTSIQYVFADNSESETVVPVVTEDTKNKTTTSTNKYFELELLFDSQNPLNKNLEYILKITPKIDSPETQITWDLPTVLESNPRHKEFVSLNKDQTYTFKVSISPKREGVYDITANVVSWQNNVNYTNSVSTTVTLNKALISQPVDSSYTISLILFVVAILAVSAAVIYLVYRYSKKGISVLRKWLTPPY